MLSVLQLRKLPHEVFVRQRRDQDTADQDTTDRDTEDRDTASSVGSLGFLVLAYRCSRAKIFSDNNLHRTRT